MAKGFRDLELWHLALELAETIYRISAQFPKSDWNSPIANSQQLRANSRFRRQIPRLAGRREIVRLVAPVTKRLVL